MPVIKSNMIRLNGTTVKIIESNKQNSVFCVELSYCYQCTHPCSNCVGNGVKDCKDCIRKFETGDQLNRERENNQIISYECQRPSPMNTPKLSFSNNKQRL